jgi:hypothetical protein
MVMRCRNCEHKDIHDRASIGEGYIMCRHAYCDCTNFQPDDSARAWAHADLDLWWNDKLGTMELADRLYLMKVQQLKERAAARDARPERGE